MGTECPFTSSLQGRHIQPPVAADASCIGSQLQPSPEVALGNGELPYPPGVGEGGGPNNQ